VRDAHKREPKPIARTNTPVGGLAMVAAALLAGAGSFVGADPAPTTPASPATAAHIKPKWTSHFGSGKYLASPVVAGDCVYIGDEDGTLSKLPLATGTAAAAPTYQSTWETDECFNGIYSKVAVGHSYSGRAQAPAVVDGIVYVATRANLVYLRSDTGTGSRSPTPARTSRPRRPSSTGSPTLVALDPGRPVRCRRSTPRPACCCTTRTHRPLPTPARRRECQRRPGIRRRLGVHSYHCARERLTPSMRRNFEETDFGSGNQEVNDLLPSKPMLALCAA
jgi:hypothetical protein